MCERELQSLWQRWRVGVIVGALLGMSCVPLSLSDLDEATPGSTSPPVVSPSASTLEPSGTPGVSPSGTPTATPGLTPNVTPTLPLESVTPPVETPLFEETPTSGITATPGQLTPTAAPTLTASPTSTAVPTPTATPIIDVTDPPTPTPTLPPEPDLDGDTYTIAQGDCDDTNPDIHPNGIEEVGDEIDSDCDTHERCFLDSDDDGYRPTGTEFIDSVDIDCQDSGEALAITPDGDCHDEDATIHPNATDVCNGVDDNCNGAIDDNLIFTTAWYRDLDADTYGNPNSSQSACFQPSGYVSNKTDCNDNDAQIHPGSVEGVGDGIDQNCDGLELCYVDADDDGFIPNTTLVIASADADCQDGTEAASSLPSGDCNDANAAVKPGATELCNGVDDDCDSSIDDGVLTTYYRDADQDGFGTSSSITQACSLPPGYVTNSQDCNDSSSAIKPTSSELTGDGIDQNCDGKETCYVDGDKDNYRPDSTTTIASNDADCDDSGEALSTRPSGDCNDANAAINPGAAELAGDNVDQDCNGKELCYFDGDLDGYRATNSITFESLDTDCTDAGELGSSAPSGDCNDSNAAIHPGAPEVCNNIDDNCSGVKDEGFDGDANGVGDCLTALEFTSSKNIASVFGTSAFSHSGPTTVEAWIKTSSSGSKLTTIVSKYDCNTQRGIVMGTQAGKFAAQWNGTTCVSNSSVANGTWKHVAVAYDGANSLTLYVDGTVSKTCSTNASTATNTENIVMGGIPATCNGTLDGYTGTTDELLLWNVLRTQEQIRQDKAGSVNAPQTGLYLYYHFDSMTSSTQVIVDWSLNARTGFRGSDSSVETAADPPVVNTVPPF